jgi:hypothetical protein
MTKIADPAIFPDISPVSAGRAEYPLLVVRDRGLVITNGSHTLHQC